MNRLQYITNKYHATNVFWKYMEENWQHKTHMCVVGFWNLPYARQDTNATIESCYATLLTFWIERSTFWVIAFNHNLPFVMLFLSSSKYWYIYFTFYILSWHFGTFKFYNCHFWCLQSIMLIMERLIVFYDSCMNLFVAFCIVVCNHMLTLQMPLSFFILLSKLNYSQIWLILKL